MPTNFTVFNSSNRDANVVYNSGTTMVPNDKMVRFTITVLDLINEPETTVIYWEIQKSVATGQPFTHMVSGSVRGCGGVTPPKPPGRIACSIDGIVGQLVRGTLYFTSANNQRKRFGVEGQTY